MSKKGKQVPPNATDRLDRGGPLKQRGIPIAGSEGYHSFVISLAFFEDAGPHVSWSADADLLVEVLKKLGEKQRDIHGGMGDRRDHFQDTKNLSLPVRTWMAGRPAILRLQENLYSFRFSGPHRVWGIMTDHVFYLLWNDPLHQSYPTTKKNT